MRNSSSLKKKQENCFLSFIFVCLYGQAQKRKTEKRNFPRSTCTANNNEFVFKSFEYSTLWNDFCSFFFIWRRTSGSEKMLQQSNANELQFWTELLLDVWEVQRMLVFVQAKMKFE